MIRILVFIILGQHGLCVVISLEFAARETDMVKLNPYCAEVTETEVVVLALMRRVPPGDKGIACRAWVGCITDLEAIHIDLC
jgi:hypothetical protein